jgi:hypothetical protein
MNDMNKENQKTLPKTLGEWETHPTPINEII